MCVCVCVAHSSAAQHGAHTAMFGKVFNEFILHFVAEQLTHNEIHKQVLCL